MNFKRALDTYFLSERTFKILILFVMLPMLIPFVHHAYGGYVKYLLVYGLFVCIWELASNRLYRRLNDKVYILAILFVCAYAVTVFINKGTCFSSNISQLVYMAVFFSLFLMSENKENETTVISYLVIVLSFVFSLASFLTYLLRIFEWYSFEASIDDLDRNIYLGLFDNIFSGMSNANVVASVAAIALLFSVAMLFSLTQKKKKVLLKVLLVVNVVLQYITLSLTESSASLVAISIAIAFFAVIWIYKRIDISTDSLKAVVSVLIGIVIVVGILGVSSLIVNNRDSFVIVSDEESRISDYDTGYENFLEKVIRATTYESSADVSSIGDSVKQVLNGRDKLWISGLTAWKGSPLFGLTREGLIEKTRVVLDEVDPSKEHVVALESGGLHCGYLAVLVSSGIVGFLILAVLVLIVWYEFLIVLLKGNVDFRILLSTSVCLYFMISELSENRILYQVSFFNIVFWIYFGYMYSYVHKEYVALKNNKELVKE